MKCYIAGYPAFIKHFINTILNDIKHDDNTVDSQTSSVNIHHKTCRYIMSRYPRKVSQFITDGFHWKKVYSTVLHTFTLSREPAKFLPRTRDVAILFTFPVQATDFFSVAVLRTSSEPS